MPRGSTHRRDSRQPLHAIAAAVGVWVCAASVASAQPPVLDVVFPPGGQAGQTISVTVGGSRLEALQSLHCSAADVKCEPAGAGQFRLSIPAATPPGLYDLWAYGSNGVSPPRSFVIGIHPEQTEAEPNDLSSAASPVLLNTVTNGRLEKAGDSDWFRFSAQRGQLVLIECWGERIDGRLRAVLEVFDSAGRRLAVNRGYFGIDPLILLAVPEDGEYVVRVQDLIAGGSPEHYYRLSIGTSPRVAFSLPNVVQRGTASRVALFGWNLPGAVTTAAGFDRLDLEIPPAAEGEWPLPALLHPAQATLAAESFVFRLPGSAFGVPISLTDAPVTLDNAANHTADSAQVLEIPSDISGQLGEGDERDWFAFRAERGEVLYFEAYGQRLGSPVDLQLSVCDQSGQELVTFADETRNIGGTFTTSHLDPAGRWVCPADGQYLVSVRNLIGGLATDPRRTYGLSVRREEQSFEVVAVPSLTEPAALNVSRGGRATLELLAFRERGMSGGIRVSARDLPLGVECPDAWLGPGVDRALLVVSAEPTAAPGLSELKLVAIADDDSLAAGRPVRFGTVVRAGSPTGWGRLVSRMPLAVADESPLRVSARVEETLEHHLYGELKLRYSPGTILDVVVDIERRDSAHAAPVRLIGVGLPGVIENQTAIIPAGQSRGFVSFYLPPHLAVGTYSLAVQAETTAPVAGGGMANVRAVSNAVAFHVKPSAFRVEIDPFAVRRVRRGETFQVAYSAVRTNGFLGKLHTELAAPGVVTNIPGIRGRGETFTGQTDHGSLQITINDDAPLGSQPYLRLLTVGVVEDQPTYLGSCWFPLEIVE
ncbi:MAG: PPC domain-containing protein [Planctomycetaceae bacterium]